MSQDSRKHGCYIDPPPVLDIMLEQLHFLVQHDTDNCEPSCADCARVAEVRKLLLQPFYPARYPHKSRSVAA